MAGSEDPPERLTPAERAKRKRQDKLDDLQEQIDSGRLVVRQMTDEERAAHEKAREERAATRRRPPRK